MSSIPDGPQQLQEEIARLRRMLDREKRARQAAEDIAEASTRRLYGALSQLEAEHRALRELTAAATHDIKNPLASIVGFVTLLRSGRLPATLQGEVLERLGAATDYTRALIDGLLDVLGAGMPEGPIVPIDLPALLADVEADLRARHPDVVVRRSVEGRVLGSPRDTRRLFDNLVENAARHAADRQPVEITLELVGQGSDVVVRVGDNGPGIPPGDRERIFGIFQRGGGATPGSGSGVGLAVAKRIAQAANGDLWLDDQPAPGGGASFLVRMPAA